MPTLQDNPIVQSRATRAAYVVNARFRAHRVTGVQRYAHEITSRLGGSPEMLAPESGKGARGHLWEQTALPRIAAGRLLYSPCASGPLLYRKQVVTFHDLFPLEHPEWYSGAYARWYDFLFRQLARNAAHLIAVSEYTKDRVAHLLGRNPDDISVVPNAASASCRLVSPEEAARTAEALNLPSRSYILSLGSQEKRKNLPAVLSAWGEAQQGLPADTWLVLAGPQVDAQVYGDQHQLQIPARVHFTGYVPEQHLGGLYSGASLFLFPSLAEGFGLPVLEAMQCGLRVITSNNTSLPEVGGDAAVYVDPLDVRTMAEAILALFPAQCAAAHPFAPSVARAKRFSWAGSAEQTEDVLLQVSEVLAARSADRRIA